MTRKDIEIDIERLNIDDLVNDSLTAIEQYGHALGMSNRHDLCGGIDGAQNVGHVAEGNEPGPGAEQGAIGVHIQLTLVRHRNELQNHALGLTQEMPRHDIGVMFHHRQNDLVAFNQPLTERGRDQIDRLGRALGEDNLIDRPSVDQLGDAAAGGFIGLGGFVGEAVQAAVDVGIGRFHHPAHRLDHRPRLLRRGRTVQIDQRLAVDLARQNGKLFTDLGDVKTHQDAPIPEAKSQSCATCRAPSWLIRSVTSPTKALISRARASSRGTPRERI